VHPHDARRIAGIISMSDVSGYVERQRGVVEDVEA